MRHIEENHQMNCVPRVIQPHTAQHCSRASLHDINAQALLRAFTLRGSDRSVPLLH